MQSEEGQIKHGSRRNAQFTDKGTGSGLSVSYDIVVNKHNGELFAKSTVGEGTKFTTKFPIDTKKMTNRR
jgi:signal transduction histidine kinase